MSSKESTIASSDEETDDNAVVSKLVKDVTLMMTELQAEPKPGFEKMRPEFKELLGRESLSLQTACWNSLSDENRRFAFVASSTDPEKNEMLAQQLIVLEKDNRKERRQWLRSAIREARHDRY